MTENIDLYFADIAKRCLGARTQMTARALARMYDSALREVGLTSAQFTLLVVIGRGQFDSISELGDRLYLEKSTLSRNLRPLENADLIERDTSKPGRAIAHRLTASGRERIIQAYPLWKSAQEKMDKSLGAEAMEAGFEFLQTVRQAAKAA